MPFVRRTRHTLRRAEFGFFGVVVYTRTQTPRFCGQALSAGDAVFTRAASRPWRMSWLIVGIEWSCVGLGVAARAQGARRQAPGRGGGALYLGRPFCQG